MQPEIGKFVGVFKLLCICFVYVTARTSYYLDGTNEFSEMSSTDYKYDGSLDHNQVTPHLFIGHWFGMGRPLWTLYVDSQSHIDTSTTEGLVAGDGAGLRVFQPFKYPRGDCVVVNGKWGGADYPLSPNGDCPEVKECPPLAPISRVIISHLSGAEIKTVCAPGYWRCNIGDTNPECIYWDHMGERNSSVTGWHLHLDHDFPATYSNTNPILDPAMVHYMDGTKTWDTAVIRFDSFAVDPLNYVVLFTGGSEPIEENFVGLTTAACFSSWASGAPYKVGLANGGRLCKDVFPLTECPMPNMTDVSVLLTSYFKRLKAHRHNTNVPLYLSPKAKKVDILYSDTPRGTNVSLNVVDSKNLKDCLFIGRYDHQYRSYLCGMSIYYESSPLRPTVICSVRVDLIKDFTWWQLILLWFEELIVGYFKLWWGYLVSIFLPFFEFSLTTLLDLVPIAYGYVCEILSHLLKVILNSGDHRVYVFVGVLLYTLAKGHGYIIVLLSAVFSVSFSEVVMALAKNISGVWLLSSVLVLSFIMTLQHSKEGSRSESS